MKIVLVGGGSGGHFYPLIAVAQELRLLSESRHLIDPALFHIGPAPFDSTSLIEQGIEHRTAPAGKVRRFSSPLNFLDGFKTFFGIIKALLQLFSIFPDVVFSTGGYAAFPTLVSARLLGIPIIIYDADATPGRVSLWSSSFARWIAVAHPDAAQRFPEKVREKIVRTGHPIRTEIAHPTAEGAHEFLHVDKTRPTILVLGGSLGAQAINNVVVDALPQLLPKYNVIHQTGKEHLDEVVGMARLSISTAHAEDRYKAFGLLNALALRMAAGIADLVICRAGSGTIFEVASWKIPAILVPIPESVSHDQTKNAFSYARAGGAAVIEQANLRTSILVAEVDRIITDAAARESMKTSAAEFSQPDAAAKIAKAILDLALEHTD